MSNFTPGPWIRIGRAVEATVNKWDMRIAAAKLYIKPMASGVAGCDQETAEANAQLISAAPDLLTAAQIGLAYINNGDWTNGVTSPCGSIDEGRVNADRDAEQIRQAILKATGTL